MVLPVLFYDIHLVYLCESQTSVGLTPGSTPEVGGFCALDGKQRSPIWRSGNGPHVAMLGQPLCPPSTQLCHLRIDACFWPLCSPRWGRMQRNAVHSRGSEKTAWKALHKVVAGCHPKRHPTSGIPKTIRRGSFHVCTVER